MRNLRDRPVGQKITFVIMLISGVVLLLAFAALFCFQAYTLRQHSAHELAVVGEITAHNCAAAPSSVRASKSQTSSASLISVDYEMKWKSKPRG